MNRQLLKSKIKALAAHLGISTGIFIVLFVLILFWWYPGLWFSIEGGWQGTRIMLVVDMVLGPLLTFIIFNPAKSRQAILFDFSCIALFQALALMWGIYAVHSQRPLAIVYWDGSFYSVDSKDLAAFDTTAADLAQFEQKLPLVIAAREPENQDEAAAGALSAFFGEGPKMYADIERFQPLSDHLERLRANSLDIQARAEKKPELAARLDAFMQRHPDKTLDDFAFIKLQGRFSNYILIVGPAGKILGQLPA